MGHYYFKVDSGEVYLVDFFDGIEMSVTLCEIGNMKDATFSTKTGSMIYTSIEPAPKVIMGDLATSNTLKNDWENKVTQHINQTSEILDHYGLGDFRVYGGRDLRTLRSLIKKFGSI